jgi:hypothetical protein
VRIQVDVILLRTCVPVSTYKVGLWEVISVFGIDSGRITGNSEIILPNLDLRRHKAM